ncbi:hypothetical protein GCM10009625_35680 [Brachybacterium fresconis]
MLDALTGAAPAFSMVTSTICSLAAWEKIAAGRAWSPLVLAIFTVRSGISTAFLDKSIPSVTGDQLSPGRRMRRVIESGSERVHRFVM